jgi:hypothetical protein
MAKLNGGPAALDKAVGQALAAEQPDWETIQKQTREYAQLAAEFGKSDPPKGSKESWTKLTATFAGSAAELDRAAHAKDRGAALQAREEIAGSCMACHRQHRLQGMGPGGFGMPPQGGPPGFGPPPGGRPPAGPPPG